MVGVSCGSEHVVVVGGQGDLYSWGRGAGGRLGLGTEEDVCSPREVVGLNTEEIHIVSAECGGDGTLLLSSEGAVFACGNNKENKLGLDRPAGWLLSGRVEQVRNTPVKVSLFITTLYSLVLPFS